MYLLNRNISEFTTTIGMLFGQSFLNPTKKEKVLDPNPENNLIFF